MKHIDLFSGIGGFTLAAHAHGIETVAFAERDQRCRDFLSKTWPGVEIHDDIKTFDGHQYAGAYLLTAGVPCQPASRAGKQGGAEDDRWLWPDALRVFAEVRPAWAIFENPPGIGDVGLAGILSDLENQGYAVRVFAIPACAVGAPHRRMRYWIVAKSTGLQCDTGAESDRAITTGHDRQAKSANHIDGSMQNSGNMADTTRGQDDSREHGHMAETQGCRRGCDTSAGGIGKDMANARQVCGSEGRPMRSEQSEGQRTCNNPAKLHSEPWSNYTWMPCADGKVRRAPDDTFDLVDGLHRSLLGALGNSITWQVAAQIIGAMIESEK